MNGLKKIFNAEVLSWYVCNFVYREYIFLPALNMFSFFSMLQHASQKKIPVKNTLGQSYKKEMIFLVFPTSTVRDAQSNREDD